MDVMVRRGVWKLMLNRMDTLAQLKLKHDGPGEFNPNREHLAVTAEQDRQKEIHRVKVIQLQPLTPSVQKLVLKTQVKPIPFTFKAGQWVDFFIDEVATVGGFSMVSSPTHLEKSGELELAIQYSTHPPAHWVHTQCRVGSDVGIRVGGDFVLDTEGMRSGQVDGVLLIGGGVGVNPLCSMIQEILAMGGRTKTTLLSSAKTYPELLFREEFLRMRQGDSGFGVQFFLTGEASKESGINDRRIGQEDIIRVLKDWEAKDLGKVQAYICGPPPMIKDMESMLTSLGVSNVFYEKWWTSVESN